MTIRLSCNSCGYTVCQCETALLATLPPARYRRDLFAPVAPRNTTDVICTKGKMKGKRGTIKGDLRSLNPNITCTIVSFDLPWPDNMRRVRIKNLREC